jgi:hypothetical protein
LQHRYSFATDSSDSIGGANGTNIGNATISGGQLVLDGSAGTYVSLPGGLLNSNTAVTIEAWVSFGASGTWARLFDFGSTAGFGTNTTGPLAFFWTSPNAGGAVLRSDVATGAGAVSISSGPSLNNRTVHFVETYEPANNVMTIYTNGSVAVISGNVANVPLSSISPDDAFIGKSQFGDPYLIASIDEFRIYGGALYSDEIRATELLGPNQLLTTSNVSLQAKSSGGNLVLKWPLAAAGFTLQSRSSLGSGTWNPVPTLPQIVGSGGTTNWQVTVPLSGGPAFFRLTK